MKNIFRFTLILVLACVWQRCADDQAPASPGSIRFAFRAHAPADHGRLATSLPEGASLFISIRQANGDDVYTLEPVALLKLGDEYMSEPLALPGGDYALTDFLVADSAGSAVYAAPKEGSELASWVDDPLPRAFMVSNDAIAHIDVQVLPTDLYEPGQFGYVTFSVDVVDVPRLRLSVFRVGAASPEFTQVHAYVLSAGDTLFQRYLPASINDIVFGGDPASTYTLVLMKDSYKTYTRTFVLSELLAELHGAPLQVTLEDAFTFTAFFRSPTYDFYIGTNEASTQPLIINWGDGTEEVWPPLHPGIYTPKHLYARPGRYHVSVAGDLAAVESVGFIFTSVDDIFLRALPGLRDFAISNVRGADSVDLSHNPKLVSLGLAYSDIRYFDIRHNPLIKYLGLEGDVDLPVPVLDQVLTELYHHVIEQQIYQGEINLRENRRGGLIGPPSPEVLTLVRSLGAYGWILYD